MLNNKEKRCSSWYGIAEQANALWAEAAKRAGLEGAEMKITMVSFEEAGKNQPSSNDSSGLGFSLHASQRDACAQDCSTYHRNNECVHQWNRLGCLLFAEHGSPQHNNGCGPCESGGGNEGQDEKQGGKNRSTATTTAAGIAVERRKSRQRAWQGLSWLFAAEMFPSDAGQSPNL
jgi:hypothetical protein